MRMGPWGTKARTGDCSLVHARGQGKGGCNRHPDRLRRSPSDTRHAQQAPTGSGAPPTSRLSGVDIANIIGLNHRVLRFQYAGARRGRIPTSLWRRTNRRFATRHGDAPAGLAGGSASYRGQFGATFMPFRMDWCGLRIHPNMGDVRVAARKHCRAFRT